jgi:hypothetical protein
MCGRRIIPARGFIEDSSQIHRRVLSYRTEQRELGKEVPESDKLERLAQKASA